MSIVELCNTQAKELRDKESQSTTPEPKTEHASGDSGNACRIPKFSFYSAPIKNCYPAYTISVEELIRLIKSDKYKKHQEFCKALRNKEKQETNLEKRKDIEIKRREYKATYFDYATVAAIFKYRNSDSKNIQSITGKASIDIDGINNAQEVKALLIKDEYFEALFYSVSGELKGIINIEPTNEPSLFSDRIGSFYDYLKDKYNISAKLDKTTRDISRATFLSYDPDAYYNPAAKIWIHTSTPSEQKEIIYTSLKDFDSLRLSKYLESIPSDDYDKWVKYGIALKRYGEENNIDAFPIFRIWSSKSKKYVSEQDCRNKWDGFNLDERTKPVTVGTIIYEGRSIATQSSNDSLKTSSLKDLLAAGIPEIRWIIQDLVREGSITYFGGASGSYKTWAAMAAGMAVATGKPFLNNFETAKSNVLYIDEENGEVTLLNRFHSLKNGNDYREENLSDIHISFFNDIKLDTEPVDNLKTLIQRTQAKLVIIDSLVRCMVGEEDKATDVRRIFGNLKQFLEKGISFILLHHTSKGKTGMNGLRGSGDLAAFADVIVMFSSNPGFANCFIAKNRHIDSSKIENFSIHFENPIGNLVRLTYLSNQEETTAQDRCKDEILQWIDNESISQFFTEEVTKLTSTQGFKKNILYLALNELCKEKELTKLKRGKYKVNRMGDKDGKL